MSKVDDFNIGDSVLVQTKHEGLIRYIGGIEGKTGDWIGVELKKEYGKNDGDFSGKKYFECAPKHGIFVRAADVLPFDEEVKAASTIQSLERMRSAKKKVKNEMNARTWNTLDNKKEQLELERGKKVRAEMGTPAVPAAKTKRRKSIADLEEEEKIFEGKEDDELIEKEYAGVKLPWPLTMDSVRAMLESFKVGKDLHYVYAHRIFEAARKLHGACPTVQEIPISEGSRITVIGDLHGQLQDLFTILTINGLPSETNMYLFNGDIVDRGNYGVECLLVVYAFKLLLPEHVYINRGNHESRAQNSWMGFEEEVLSKFDGGYCGDATRSRRIFETLSNGFDNLPLASIIQGKVFVVHGGLARDHGITIDHIRNIKRKREPPIDKPGMENRLYEDLMWSDPRPTANYPEPLKGYKVSERGAGVEFGPEITNHFCMTNSVALVIRSHECVQEGYEVLHGGRLITIFSASRYCGTQTNKGAFITFDKLMQPEIQQFYAHNITSNAFLPEETEEKRMKTLEDDTVMMLVERICDCKPDLYYHFTTMDDGKKGLVSKVQWATALKSVLGLDLPFLSYAHRLVDPEEDGQINYAKFIERFRIAMRPEDSAWMDSVTEKVCEKLYDICGNIEQCFEVFDVNSDGTIEYEEFANTLKKLDVGLSDIQILELMRTIDVNKDSQIELSEFVDRFQVSFSHVVEKEKEVIGRSLKRAGSTSSMVGDAPEWDEWTRKALEKVGRCMFKSKLSLPQAFAKFDADDSGWVSYEEFSTAILAMDLAFTAEEGLKLAKAVDGNGSGRINYMEFVNAFRIADKGPKKRASLLPAAGPAEADLSTWQAGVIQQVANVLYQHRIQLRSAFRMFDTDNDGKVTAAEFHNGLKAINALLDSPLSEMQMKELMNALDRNGDGSLDYKEFLEGFQIVDITKVDAASA